MESLPITTPFVAACFAVTLVAVAVTVWIMSNYQTKADSKALEERIDKDLGEFRDSLTQVWNKVNEVQNNMFGIGRDVSYIRGHLEARAKAEGLTS